jgi:D-cysteine desulfhydrase
MHLSRFPRRRYTAGPTPIHALPNLTRDLGGPNLFIKRDDLLGGAGGGNKTRKLEFLVADALAQGADTLITCGAVQSNHCRLTLSAACTEGLACHLVLEERVPKSYDEQASGNNFLYRLMGVEKINVVPGGTDLGAAMVQAAADLEKAGRKGYIIPGGGSNSLGALGYVACAEELLAQTFDMGLRVDHVVVASGSGGTHAGILAGMHGNNAQIPVTGVSVRHPQARQEASIAGLAASVCDRLGLGAIPDEAVVVADQYVGDGYSLPTASMAEAVQLFARREAILLDPVYTGKAAAGLIGLVRQGAFGKDDNVLFVHTGGAPSLYHYRDDVLREG